jgi:3-methyladenine DNA glycosylase AlkD
LAGKYKGADEKGKESIYRFYLGQTARINNWDLVDVTCGHIVGSHLMDRSKDDLYELARSKNLWERRMAIVSTYVFIKNNDFWDAFEIARILLTDKHDLIHKAVGWMLREIGKRDRKALEIFLGKYYEVLPRTTLRYAIERFPEKLRKRYLHKKINIISNI